MVRENQRLYQAFSLNSNETILHYSTLSMQGRFKMEYRLFTIVRYNYRDYRRMGTQKKVLSAGARAHEHEAKASFKCCCFMVYVIYVPICKEEEGSKLYAH